jgi:ANTAR domain
MSGKHDRANADARARAGQSGVPADGTYRNSEGRPGVNPDAAGQDGTRLDGAGQDGAGRPGVSRAGAGDGLGMTDRSDGGSRGSDRDLGPVTDGPTVPMDAVARRTPTGWRVGDEEVPDLTSAMVLADLLAAELSAEEQAELDAAAAAPPAPPRDAAAHNTGQLAGVSTPPRPAGRTGASGSGASGSGASGSGASGARMRGPGAHRAEETPFGPADAAQIRQAEQVRESEQLKETVAQLERALTVRVRVEQAIGVLSERHRIRPRQAFELLRSASRARGQKIMETASQVIASATNPLLRLPEELAKPPMPRRLPRRSRGEA